MKLSQINEMCEQYMQLRDQIKLLETKKEEIASTLKALGSMETEGFAVILKEIEQNRVVGADTLLERVGIVKCTELDLITKSTYVKLDVKAKIKKVA
jgi:hypothetical protein